MSFPARRLSDEIRSHPSTFVTVQKSPSNQIIRLPRMAHLETLMSKAESGSGHREAMKGGMQGDRSFPCSCTGDQAFETPVSRVQGASQGFAPHTPQLHKVFILFERESNF
jgi:hypothetical protein